MDVLDPYMNYIIATLIVFGGLIVLSLIIRAFSGRVRNRKGSRLGISEYFDIDKSRQLVLVRRDGVEHLLLVGGGQDLVIEHGIGASQAGADEPAFAGRATYPPVSRELYEPEEDSGPREPVLQAVRQAPRPAVFGENAPNVRPIRRGGENERGDGDA